MVVPEHGGVEVTNRTNRTDGVQSDLGTTSNMNYERKFPVRINVRMEEETRDEAQKLAFKMGVSTSALFRIAMKQYIFRKTNF